MKSIYSLILIYFFLQAGNIVCAQTWNSVQAEKLYQQALTEIKSARQDKAMLSLEKAVRLNADHIDAQVQLARLYMASKRFEPTINISLMVIQKSPKYEDIYYYIIGSYLSTKQTAKALRYTNLALGYFPRNKDFTTKKLAILDLMQRFQDGDTWSQGLLHQFPTDQDVRRAVAGHYEAKADWYSRKHLDNLATTYYEKALELVPHNKDLTDKMNRLVVHGGDINTRLAKVNETLNSNNRSYTALYNKLGLLQETSRYAEALDVLNTILRYYPKDKKALALSSSLRKDAAGYYQNTDAYMLYQSILEQNPTDEVALPKVIGMATAMGDLNQAVYRVDRALQREPTNRRLLKQKMDLAYLLQRYRTAADIAFKLYNGANKPYQSEILQTINACGNYYLREKLVDSAVMYFDRALLLDPENLVAIQGRVNGLVMGNNSELALIELNRAVRLYPNDLDLQLKKAGYMGQTGELSEAARFSEQLFKRYPDNPKVRSLYLDQKLAVANAFMLGENYTEAEQQLRQILTEEPGNKDALNYLSNILDLQKHYNEALDVVNTALVKYPNDRDFLQKKASILYNDHQFAAAARLSAYLSSTYSFNPKYKKMTIEAWSSASLDYQKKQQPDSALWSLNHVIAINPADSAALLRKTNLLIVQNRFEQALTCTDEALSRFEYAEPFLLSKAIILDSLKRYTEAAAYADTLAKRFTSDKNRDYADLVRSKTLHNAFGLTLLNSSFTSIDGTSTPPAYNIATLSYSRTGLNKTDYSAQLIFLGRQQGTGIMLNGNIGYKVNKTRYWNAALGLSNNVLLPKYRIAYSFFQTFGNGLEGELGGRYFKVGGIDVASLITGLGKTFGPFGVNARVFGIRQERNLYFAFSGGARYELGGQDLLQANFGLGTSPDDMSRLILFPALHGILNRSIGAAYRHTFRYRTSIGLAGTYTNQKITDTSFTNQYDLQLFIQVKF
jgi:cellulose synthase operon protein C